MGKAGAQVTDFPAVFLRYFSRNCQVGRAFKLGAGHFAKFIFIGLDEKKQKNILSVIFYRFWRRLGNARSCFAGDH